MQLILAAFISVLLVSPLAYSNKKKHRHHEAHVHGAAQLQIALEGLTGKVIFEGAADGLLGFEHAPKTEAEKNKLSDLKLNFEKNISTFIIFDAQFGCEMKIEKNELEIEKNGHAHYKAEYNLACKSSPKNSIVNFDFTNFKRLKTIDGILIFDELQKSFEIKGKTLSLDIK